MIRDGLVYIAHAIDAHSSALLKINETLKNLTNTTSNQHEDRE